MNTYPTYQLPDHLGGGEVVAVPSLLPLEVGGEPATLVAFHNTTFRMVVPTACLVEVKPPLPEEPPEGFYLAGKQLWERYDRSRPNTDYHWWRTGDGAPHTWAETYEFIKAAGCLMVRLVADPIHNAPELPWTLESDDRAYANVQISKEDPGKVFIHTPEVNYSTEQAAQIASAIWAAVRQGGETP